MSLHFESSIKEFCESISKLNFDINEKFDQISNVLSKSTRDYQLEGHSTLNIEKMYNQIQVEFGWVKSQCEFVINTCEDFLEQYDEVIMNVTSIINKKNVDNLIEKMKNDIEKTLHMVNSFLEKYETINDEAIYEIENLKGDRIKEQVSNEFLNKTEKIENVMDENTENYNQVIEELGSVIQGLNKKINTMETSLLNLYNNCLFKEDFNNEVKNLKKKMEEHAPIKLKSIN